MSAQLVLALLPPSRNGSRSVWWFQFCWVHEICGAGTPAQSSAVEQLKVNDLKLEIQIRPDALLVGDRIGGLIQRIPMVNGQHDIAALGPLVQMIKGKFPDTTTATILAQPDTSYELLVQVMDAVREFKPPTVKGQPVAGAPPAMLLFPDISIGDAPVSVAQKK